MKKTTNKLLTTILLILSIIFIFSIYHINILTTKYLLILLGIILLLDIILIFRITRKKIKPLSYIFTIIIIIILSLGTYYILKTNNILEGFNKNYTTYNYKLLVLKENNYDNITDINNKTLGYYKTETEETSKSLEKINNIINTENIPYEDIYTLAEDLLKNKVDSILVEESYLNIITENSDNSPNIDNFKDKIKIIYSFTIVIKLKNTTKDANVTKESFNVYISGIDTYGSVSSVSRSDVNMIATINPKTHQVLLTSIPRDYYVTLHNTKGYKDKLTHAGLYGVDMSIQTLEDLLDIEINYYIKVNFTSIIDIVDSLDGVTVYSDYNFTSRDGYNYVKGYNYVNGEEALSFVRERYAFTEGDRQRIKNQQALIEALYRKCTSKSIITKYNSLLNSISGSFVTNISSDRITSLAKMQLSNNYNWTITTNSLDGTNSSNYTYSIPNQKSYVMEPNETSIEKARKLIEEVINGELLESTYNGDSSNYSTVTKNTSTNDTKTKQEEKITITPKLEAKLIKDNITFTEGDEYTYHGYKATYNNEDVTDKTNVNFNINGAMFDNYSELISYVSNLTTGEYTINYTIAYQNESKTLTQKVTIETPYNNITTEEETKEAEEENDISE